MAIASLPNSLFGPKAEQQKPLSENDIQSELQQSILLTLIECDRLWKYECRSIFRLFGLMSSSPSNDFSRSHLRTLIRTKETERWINSLIPLFDLHNENEALLTMKRLIHCNPNHPRLMDLCQSIINQQQQQSSLTPTGEAIQFLTGYLVLGQQRVDPAAYVDESIVSIIANGVINHSDWLEWFDDSRIGYSLFSTLCSLPQQQSLNAITELANRIEHEPLAVAIKPHLMPLVFERVNEDDSSNVSSLPLLTKESLTEDQRRVICCLLRCSRFDRDSSRIFECRFFRLPCDKKELRAMVTIENEDENEDASDVDFVIDVEDDGDEMEDECDMETSDEDDGETC
jgi:hypothetical protein